MFKQKQENLLIDLFTLNSASPNIRKVSSMLEEIGVPHTVKPVARGSDGAYPAEFLQASPNETVPAIRDHDNGAGVFESTAILIYLAEKTGNFLPRDLKTRGEVMQWLAFEAANIGPAMGELYHALLHEDHEGPTGHLDRYKAKMARYCAILERHLEGREFLCGDYSIADIAIHPWMAILEDIADIRLRDYPRLEAWAATIDGRSRKATAA